MKKLFKLVSFWSAALVLGCGGGGGSPGGTNGGGSTTTPVASIEVLASAAELRSGDAVGIKITAIAKDSQNNALADRIVIFSASSGTLSAVSANTGTEGVASATLSAGNDKSNRVITVNVTSGEVAGAVKVSVAGTALSVSGATSLLQGATSTYSVSLKDSNGSPNSGVSVTAKSALGNSISPGNVSTDSAGSATFQLAASKPGTDTLTFSAGGASQSLTVTISNQDFVFVSPSISSELAINQDILVSARYRISGAGSGGNRVTFSTTRGSVVGSSSVLTDSSGIASAVIRSASAGRAVVTAQLDGSTTASLPLSFISTQAAAVVLQSSGAALAPNDAGSSSSQVQLTASVRDAVGNPVKGATVYFTAVKDLSGGSIKTGSAVTDANGLATDVFIAGAVSTAANGVVVRATVANPDVSQPAIISETQLTVSARALFITIGSNNTIEKLSTTYRKTFSVQINDANGAAVANQTVTLSYFAPVYKRGRLAYDASTSSWEEVLSEVFECVNEDKDRDGILGSNEDTDGNKALTPGLPAVIAPAVVTTDASGSAEFTLTYGQQYANWFVIQLSAKAAVAGTESTGSYSLVATLAASDLTDKNVPPAAVISPYGLGACPVIIK